MTARHKTSPFGTRPQKDMRDQVISEPAAYVEVNTRHAKALAAAACEPFVALLRTMPVEETVKTGLPDLRSVLFSGGERLLWTTTFESKWHRYIRQSINPSTIH